MGVVQLLAFLVWKECVASQVREDPEFLEYTEYAAQLTELETLAIMSPDGFVQEIAIRRHSDPEITWQKEGEMTTQNVEHQAGERTEKRERYSSTPSEPGGELQLKLTQYISYH
eukprot:TRINITY_DN1006_c0_g1_i3.p7 TRINITY_DN1006_c0_g1~~TRINITY_DN1006_c0_g1_i3.p7  ORF type:complete len:114 (+),score=1.18 TRINITY_DN1006_c0_g1_i3:1468-1809(+)